MLAEDVDKQRCVRFYHWAKSDLEREIAEGYPILRKIPNVDVGSYLELAQSLSPPERNLYASTCFRWAHSAALTLLGNPFTTEERALREDYQWERGLIGSRIEQKLQTPAGSSVPINSRKLRRLVQDVLEPLLLGEPKRGWGGLMYITPIGEWFIGTRIQIMDKGTRLRYFQSVMTSETDRSVQLLGPAQNATDILGWLGVGRRDWVMPFDEMAEPTAEALALACGHFIHNIGSILEGLRPKIHSSWDGVHWWQRNTAL